MVQNLILHYENQEICLINKTETKQYLLFESPGWMLEIGLRDDECFLLTIKHWENPVDEAEIRNYVFNHLVWCDIFENNVSIRQVIDYNTREEYKIEEFPWFLTFLKDIVQQLEEELLHAFEDPEYLEIYQRWLETPMKPHYT